MIDFATPRRKVNAASKNKRVLFERLRFGRMNWPGAARREKKSFGSSFRIVAQRQVRNPYTPSRSYGFWDRAFAAPRNDDRRLLAARFLTRIFN
jgi:hypothetical protein